MGLRKMWRRVRSLSERPHNLLAISDLHLGCDLRPGVRFDRPRPADASLTSFIDWHAAHRAERKPWRLVLNGDIVDFVAITLVPEGPAPFELSDEERKLGLAPSEPKCVWKLQRTAERHREVFDAFARFVQKGNSIHIVRGNHDTEWHWPAVQTEFRRILAERAGAISAAARRKLDRSVEFHDWFYVEHGHFYAEHGHAHDRYSVQSDFFADHGGAIAEQEMELPLSSKVLRYFANRYTEQVDVADDVDSWGLKEYLEWVVKAGNPLHVAADYFVMVARVVYPIFRQSLRFSRLVRAPRTGELAEKLAAISARPGEQSLFDSMQLFYLDRMLLALLSLICAGSAWFSLSGLWARAGAVTLTGIVFAALNALLAEKRKTDAHPLLREAARRVAAIFDVKYIVMGHSHRPVDESAGNGAHYFNLGSWTGLPREGFPYVQIDGGSARLQRWKGPPILELPLRAREAPPLLQADTGVIPA
jgi:UDP-2,3-diacylglucosamine pyrophosphatase LpxH